jgi:predicted ester cyclase
MMSVEQVGRDFITNITNVEKTKAHLTADAVASGGMLPQPVPAMQVINIIAALKTAIPDLKFEVQQVTVNGNQASVKLQVSGTNTGPLSLPLPGKPISAPPSGKKVSWKDGFLLTVQGDKISHVQIESPADGGLPVLLGQIGVKLPSM